jgi:nucleoside-diphosphate-sugar epimerase
MRVLLTGGYGCIGSWIARNLVERGDEVWVYDLKEDLRRMNQVMDEPLWRQVRFIQGDVTDLPVFRAALEKHQVTHVIHLAGLQVPVCRADPLLGAKVNVLGTLAVFEAVKSLGPRIQGLVYASSAAVYGPAEAYAPIAYAADAPVAHAPGSPIPDDAPLLPTTHYGVFKCCNEGNARIYYQDHGLSSIGLRPWTVYGVGRDFGMTSEPTKAIKCAGLGRPYRISYGGRQDLQFADDVARTFIRCLEVPYEGARSYNLRGAVVDLPEFHRKLCEVAPEAERLITFGDKQLPIAYDLSDERLQRDLGPMPRTPLVEGICQTLERFRQLHAEGRLDVSDL